MAEIKMVLSEYRPCVVGKEKKPATFHRWADVAQTVGESALRGGPAGGQLWQVFAIVEFADGTVAEVYPSKIQFTDVAVGTDE